MPRRMTASTPPTPIASVCDQHLARRRAPAPGRSTTAIPLGSPNSWIVTARTCLSFCRCGATVGTVVDAPVRLDEVRTHGRAHLTQMLRADAQENRDRILAAARALFAERGLDVGMREIARRAGVGPATLYRRFPTKQALIDEAFAVELAVVPSDRRGGLRRPGRLARLHLGRANASPRSTSATGASSTRSCPPTPAAAPSRAAPPRTARHARRARTAGAGSRASCGRTS